jgi:hypothetical protein
MNCQRAEASFDWATFQAIQEVLQHCAGDAIAWNVSVAKKIVIGFASKVHYAQLIGNVGDLGIYCSTSNTVRPRN